MRRGRLPLILFIVALAIVATVLFAVLRTVPERTGDVPVTPLPIATLPPSPGPGATTGATVTEVPATEPAAPSPAPTDTPTPEPTASPTPSPAPTPTAPPPYELTSTPYAESALTIADAYRAATIDAMLAEQSETHTLVDLIPGDANAALDDSGRALLITYSSVSGATVGANEPLPAFSEKELAKRCKDEGLSASEPRDVTLRLCELMGLPYSPDEITLTAFTVDVSDVFRPAYETDPRAHSGAIDLPADAPVDYVEWFNARIIASYYPLTRPWTRLGYSYDWNPITPEYGLSEFMVKPGSRIETQYSLSATEFVSQNG